MNAMYTRLQAVQHNSTSGLLEARLQYSSAAYNSSITVIK